MTQTGEYPPRGLNRDEAARYIGVGPRKFDEMVSDRRMPKPRRVDGRVIWDRHQLDAAFSDLPVEKTVLADLVEKSRLDALAKQAVQK